MKNKSRKNAVSFASNGALPYYRSVNVLSVAIHYMEEKGIKTEDLLADIGIESCDLDNPDVFVTSEQELKVMSRVVSRVPDPELGFILGRQYHIGILNKIGVTMLSSNTLFDALKVLAQYIELSVAYFQYSVDIIDNLALVKMRQIIDFKDLELFIIERELSCAYRVACDLIQFPLPLKELRVAYPKPAHAALYSETFRCPVRFNSREHTFVFDKQYLFMKLPMANSLMKNLYEKECRILCRRLQIQKSVSDQVKHNIIFGIEGLPSMERVARSMAMGQRTLRRRLAEEGTSYKAIVAEILRDKAIGLIRTSSQPIENIAEQLGYSNVPNFYRAFKGWTGYVPSYYRITPTDRDIESPAELMS